MENRRIETQRLMLRPITQEDAPAVFVWASDPEVNRYMPYPLHKSIEDTRGVDRVDHTGYAGIRVLPQG